MILFHNMEKTRVQLQPHTMRLIAAFATQEAACRVFTIKTPASFAPCSTASVKPGTHEISHTHLVPSFIINGA